MRGILRSAASTAVYVAIVLGGAPPAAAQTIGCGEIRAYCYADQDDCPCDNDYAAGGCANATGVGGILSANGNGSIALDDLVFSAMQLPPNAPTLFFTNQIEARTPFRNGILCMDPQGSKILRVGVAGPAVDGSASEGPGIVSYLASEYVPPDGILEPGDTWYFQCYYRDPGHCVSNANFTNAIAVTFAPAPPPTTARIGGRVFYDFDESGAFEVGLENEVGIEGWRVELTGGGAVQTVFTDALGRFEFFVPKDGVEYELSSIAPPPGYVPEAGALWVASGDTVVAVESGEPEVCVDFGVFALENMPELARSKGFWHNAGASLLADCDPEWREVVNGLCLRTNVTNPDGEEGTLFTVPLDVPFDEAFSLLSDFLVSPTQGVLANNLSKQFCAANLNRSCGVLQETTYIDRNLDGVLFSFEELAVITLGLLCDPCAANTGPDGDEACRASIMMCLEEWEGTNSGGERIYTKRVSPREFESPYMSTSSPEQPQ